MESLVDQKLEIGLEFADLRRRLRILEAQQEIEGGARVGDPVRQMSEELRPPGWVFGEQLLDDTLVLAEAARREALFEQSFAAERTRGDALARRFEEALKQASTEPVTRPTRDFDLD